MPFNGLLSGTQLTSITTEQFFDLVLGPFGSGERAHLQFASVPGSASGVVFAVYALLNSGFDWDTDPLIAIRLETTDAVSGSVRKSLAVGGFYQLRGSAQSVSGTVTSATFLAKLDQVELVSGGS